MPIVPGNDQEPVKRSSGSLFGWIVFLLVFGRPIYNLVRSFTNGIISDQQLMILAGGAVALIVLASIVRRVNQIRDSGAPTLSAPYVPPSDPSASLKQYSATGDRGLPSAPRFEPIITGKVVLAGVILVLALIGSGFLIVVNMAIP